MGHGWSAEELTKLAGGNLLRVFSEVSRRRFSSFDRKCIPSAHCVHLTRRISVGFYGGLHTRESFSLSVALLCCPSIDVQFNRLISIPYEEDRERVVCAKNSN